MERLYEIHASGRYDLVIVDTPPTRNALDFLEAPERMADFFSSRLLRWLTVPYRSRLVNFATKPFYRVADTILGSAFLEDIAEFFLLFQTMYDGFVERARSVQRTLEDKRTTFVVVSTLESAPLREAEFFIDALGESRVPPRRRGAQQGAARPTCSTPRRRRGGQAAWPPTRRRRRRCRRPGRRVAGERRRRPRAGRREVAGSFLDFRVVATRESEQRKELAALPDVIATVPYFDSDIHDLAGLLRLGEQIWR